MVYDITSQSVLAFILVLFRIGSMMMLMPVFGDTRISTRVRIALVIAISLVILPLVQDLLPDIPTTPLPLLTMGISEAIIGLVIGAIMRLTLMATQMAGTIIAFQLSLGFVTSVDPTQGVQGAILGAFLSLTASILIIVTGLHHVLIAALYDSYQIFPPSQLPNIGDSLQLAVKTVTEAFNIGVRMAAPFLLFGLVFYAGLGIISRLMPQLQIFFIAIPANIWLGLMLLAFLLHVMMQTYLAHLEEQFVQFTL